MDFMPTGNWLKLRSLWKFVHRFPVSRTTFCLLIIFDLWWNFLSYDTHQIFQPWVRQPICVCIVTWLLELLLCWRLWLELMIKKLVFVVQNTYLISISLTLLLIRIPYPFNNSKLCIDITGGRWILQWWVLCFDPNSKETKMHIYKTLNTLQTFVF